MKSYDIVAWAIEADLYCCSCAGSWAAKAGVDLDNGEDCELNAVAPLFADECGNEDLFCGACDSQIWQGGDEL